MQTLQHFSKVYYSLCSRIQDIDPIMAKFESVLLCYSSDALSITIRAVVLETPVVHVVHKNYSSVIF